MIFPRSWPRMIAPHSRRKDREPSTNMSIAAIRAVQHGSDAGTHRRTGIWWLADRPLGLALDFLHQCADCDRRCRDGLGVRPRSSIFEARFRAYRLVGYRAFDGWSYDTSASARARTVVRLVRLKMDHRRRDCRDVDNRRSD